MSGRIRVPIRVIRQELQPKGEPSSPPKTAPVTDAAPPVVEVEELPPSSSVSSRLNVVEEDDEGAGEEELEMWRDRALRLEVEMDNFRKRQRRLADSRVAADREQLLRTFLTIADDLSRALSADGADVESLRQGVELTYQSLMQLLDQEGVEPIQAEGASFDPAWHEAVGVVSHQEAGIEPEMVVEVVQPGYRLGEQLLRPARVIVAT